MMLNPLFYTFLLMNTSLSSIRHCLLSRTLFFCFFVFRILSLCMCLNLMMLGVWPLVYRSEIFFFKEP